MPWMGVNPMLERIDGRNPRKDCRDAFQVNSPGSMNIIWLVKNVEMFRGEKFHRHRRHLAKLDGSAAIGEEVLFAGGNRMECMSGLMQNCFEVSLKSHRVHEDEGHSRFGECALIPAGRLGLSICKIQQPARTKLGELPG